MLLSQAIAQKYPRMSSVRQVGKNYVAETTCDVCGDFFYDEDIHPITGAHDYDLSTCSQCRQDIRVDIPPPDGCVRCNNPVTMVDQIQDGVFMCRDCERETYE